MGNKILSRRAVLRGGMGISIALPMLEIMGRSRPASAMLPGGSPRLLVVYTPHGRHKDSDNKWRPQGTGPDFELGSLMTPFAPYQDRMIHVSGLPMETCRNQNGNSHTRGAMHALTCRFHDENAWLGNGISIDQKIANALAEVSSHKYASLQLGVRATPGSSTDPVRAYLAYRGPLDPITCNNDPQSAFDLLFGGDFEGGQTENDDELARIREERRSVLDFVGDDFDRLNGKLGHADRMRLEEHVDTIREIEQSIDDFTPAGAACAMPEYSDPGDPDEDYPEVGRQMTKLAAMALACELTPVMLLQWSTGTCSVRHSWVSQHAGSSGFHGITHLGSDGQETHDAIQSWYIDQIRHLLDDLDELEEGDGTVLDNTVVLWVGGEQGTSTNHSFDDMCYVIFGRGGGVLDAGKHVEYQGRSANDLMITIQNAMGLEDEAFGEPEFVQGTLPGILA